ncbi:hypothetical protein LguiA_002292 [Lonicera macranthoides]
MSEVVASLEVALTLQEKKDSSLLDEYIFDFDETYDHQEVVGSSSIDSENVYTDSSTALVPLSHSPPTGPIEGIEKPSLGEDTLSKEIERAWSNETKIYATDECFGEYQAPECGSLQSLIHFERGKVCAKIGEGQTPLDWESRLRIAIGAARGIAYIHTQIGGKLVHGNIKVSNIFLNSQQDGCICKHGLATLINQVVPPDAKIPGYRAPKVTNTSEVSQASDVYSYRVLLLDRASYRKVASVFHCWR